MPKIALAGASLLPENAEAVLEFAVLNGYQAVELYGDFPQAHFDHLDCAARENLRRMAVESGISLSVHAPWVDLNIASFNEGIRKESVRQHLGVLDLAEALGAGVVVIHAGNVSGKVAQAREICFNHAVDSIREIAEEAAGKGIVLCLENVLFEPWAVDRTYRDLLTIKEKAGVPGLKYTLDFGHARLAGGISEGIAALGQDIYHIHVSDNNGDGDDHQVFGRGDLDYSPYLKFLKSFPGSIVMEVMGLTEDARKRALESRNNLLKLLHEQERHAL